MFTGSLFYCFVLIGYFKTSGTESTSILGNDFCTKEDLLNVRLIVTSLRDKVLEQKNEILEQKNGILEQKRDILEQKNDILEQKKEIFEIKTHLSGQNMEETNVENTNTATLIQKIQKQLSTQNETLYGQAYEIDDLRRDLVSLQQQLNNTGKSSCPNGYIKFQQSCYMFYENEELTWSQSVAYCEAHGSSLLVLETMAEYDYLVSYMKTFDKKDDYWTAATDADAEGVWTWERNGSPAEILPWATDQPNSFGGDQDCAEIGPSLKFGLNDDECSSKNRPLCEMILS